MQGAGVESGGNGDGQGNGLWALGKGRVEPLKKDELDLPSKLNFLL